MARLSKLHQQDLEAYRYLVEEADRFAGGNQFEQQVLALSGMMPLEYSGESKKVQEFAKCRPGVDFMNKFSAEIETLKGKAFAQNLRGQTYLFYLTRNHDLLKGIRLKWATHYHNNCVQNRHFSYSEKWEKVIDAIEASKPLIRSAIDLEPEQHGARLPSKVREVLKHGVTKPDEHVSKPGGAGASSVPFGKQFFTGASKSVEDTYQAGSLALMRQDFQTAKELFVAAASEGHGSAVYNLFSMYGGGCLSPYDVDQAVHYWRKAAELNHPTAKQQLFMLEDADRDEFGVQASVKYAGLPAAPGFLSAFLITSACRSLVATCELHGATSDVIAYELDAASSSEYPMVHAFIQRTGVSRDIYRGGMNRLEEKSPADWVTDGLNELYFAMKRNGVDEHLCLVARCTMVGYLILKSDYGSQSSPLLGVREFMDAERHGSEDFDDEIPF